LWFWLTRVPPPPRRARPGRHRGGAVLRPVASSMPGADGIDDYGTGRNDNRPLRPRRTLPGRRQHVLKSATGVRDQLSDYQNEHPRTTEDTRQLFGLVVRGQIAAPGLPIIRSHRRSPSSGHRWWRCCRTGWRALCNRSMMKVRHPQEDRRSREPTWWS